MGPHLTLSLRSLSASDGYLRWGLATALLPALLGLISCSRSSGSNQGPGGMPGAPVTVALSVQKTVPIELRAIGTVVAYNSTAIKAQAGGVITGVHFEEGRHVEAGDLLFAIDPRPYAAAVKQAEGILVRDSAQLRNALKEAERSEVLLKRSLVSQEEYESSRANAEALKGVVEADQAALTNARLNLEYCSVRAPGHGITGRRLVDAGNVVKANDVTLVVINQVQPIYVNFSVPQQTLPALRAAMAGAKLKVRALIPGAAEPEPGELTFVDNAVDQTTGTVLLKGTFANGQERLWPGQFVDVALILGEEQNAVAVPARAVQTGQEGSYVFVVKADHTAELRPVKVARMQDQEAVIAEGLQPNEQVVTDGQLRLTPGAKVEIKSNGPKAEAPKAEEPKPEEPKAEGPKAEGPKP